MKLTEDETVNLLKTYLENKGWDIGDNFCLGQKHGIDIKAHKDEKILLIEVKGARAGDNSPTKKRDYFSTGQIKTHFGVALVKILHEKIRNPTAKLAIAHPDDSDIKKSIGYLIPFLKELGIIHYWVSENEIIEE